MPAAASWPSAATTTAASGVSRPPQHPTNYALFGANAEAVQGRLAGVRSDRLSRLN